jgi:hypothetical protein
VKAYHSSLQNAARWIGLALILCGWLIAPRALAGTWLPLVNQPTHNGTAEGISMMLLLSDGTVMCGDSATNGFWFRLTPDQYGSYVNGTWTQLANANYGRVYYTSDILTNGTVFVAGGEDGLGRNRIEIYDPVTNSWSEIFAPTNLYNPNLGDYFADTISAVIPDGDVLMVPALKTPGLGNTALLYNPGSGIWSDTGALAQGVRGQGECSWVKLADGSILTVDPNLSGNPPYTTERYIPALNQWIADSNLQATIWNTVPPLGGGGSAEIGPGFLLPNGHAFFAGGNNNYALYTPSGNTNAGTWEEFTFTNGLECADMPGAMMANGKILLVLANNCNNTGCLGQTYYYYEYDYSVNPPAGTFTPVTAPTNVVAHSQVPFMLDLPDGTVLFSTGGTSQLLVYKPDGPPLAAGKPAIISITTNADGSYHLVGIGLNGISEGAAFGDDGQMASDYPLVRLTNNTSGLVYYARTYNWSSASIQTGNTPETTEFTLLNLPQSLPAGTYSLVVTANGIASDPVSFNGPVWVNFNYAGAIQNGTQVTPYKTLAQGTNAVASGGTVAIDASTQPSSSHETMKISKPMTIISVNGHSTIGN